MSDISKYLPVVNSVRKELQLQILNDVELYNLLGYAASRIQYLESQLEEANERADENFTQNLNGGLLSYVSRVQKTLKENKLSLEYRFKQVNSLKATIAKAIDLIETTIPDQQAMSDDSYIGLVEGLKSELWRTEY